MTDKPRTDIEQTPLKTEIEAVFRKSNMDEDCSTIAHLLSPYVETLRQSLNDGNDTEAATLFFEVLESLTYHFVEERHYEYFDDMYSPDYVCQEMMEAVIGTIRQRHFPDEALKRLEVGLKKLAETEAYRDYGIPYALDLWQNSQTD